MIIVDLRTAPEIARKPAPGALLLPVRRPPLVPQDFAALATLLSGIPPFQDVAFLCAKGVRSAVAAATLAAIQPGRSGQILDLGGVN